jgi:hypothetical protein
MLLADGREIELVFGIVRLDQVVCNLVGECKKPVDKN